MRVTYKNYVEETASQRSKIVLGIERDKTADRQGVLILSYM